MSTSHGPPPTARFKQPIQKIFGFIVLSLFIFFSLFAGNSSSASSYPLEIRTPLGIGVSNPKLLNEGIDSRFQVQELLTFGADALFVANSNTAPEWQGWGFGLRFDSVSSIKYDESHYFEVAAHDFALLIVRRWPRFNNEFGPFFSYGVYTPVYVNYRPMDGQRTQFKANSTRSFAIGFEWITRLDVYILGAQIGYHYLTADGFQDQSGNRLLTPTAAEKNADLSAIQAKFILGLGF